MGRGWRAISGSNAAEGPPRCWVFEVGAVQVPPDRALEVEARRLIFIEAMLLVASALASASGTSASLDSKWGEKAPFGQAGLAHDPGDPGGGDTVTAERS